MLTATWSKGIVARRSIQKRPLRYCIAIFFGSVISSPVAVLMYVVRKVSTISTRKSTSVTELITSHPMPFDIAGSNAISRGIAKQFQVARTITNKSHRMRVVSLSLIMQRSSIRVRELKKLTFSVDKVKLFFSFVEFRLRFFFL